MRAARRLRAVPDDSMPQANPREAFAAWTLKHGKRTSNDLLVRQRVAVGLARLLRAQSADVAR